MTSCRAAVMWFDADRLSADTMHKPMSDEQIAWEAKHHMRPRGADTPRQSSPSPVPPKPCTGGLK